MEIQFCNPIKNLSNYTFWWENRNCSRYEKKYFCDFEPRNNFEIRIWENEGKNHIKEAIWHQNEVQKTGFVTEEGVNGRFWTFSSPIQEFRVSWDHNLLKRTLFSQFEPQPIKADPVWSILTPTYQNGPCMVNLDHNLPERTLYGQFGPQPTRTDPLWSIWTQTYQNGSFC